MDTSKVASNFNGGVMDGKLFFFEKTSFKEVYLDVNIFCVYQKTRLFAA